MKQKLWIVSELFPPEETSTGYIMGEIANAFSTKYDVTVICGPTVYDKDKCQDSRSKFILNQGVNVIRVSGINENKNNIISRVRKFLFISWRLYRVVRKSISSSDKVFMVSNPFPLILFMGALHRRRHFELTMLVHDVFPEALYTEMHLPSFLYNVLQNMFNKAYAQMDVLISLGRDMTDVLSQKIIKYRVDAPQIVQIENWGDVDSITPLWNDNNSKIVLQYAGNLGHAQGVLEFVKLIEKSCNPNILFSIWGTGTESDTIAEYITQNHIQNVFLNGPYLRSQQNEVLNQADLSLIILVDGMYGLGVPSKSYNIMAAGKPILFWGPSNSEISLTVNENNIGYCFDSNQITALLNFLNCLDLNSKHELREMGKRSRKLVEDKYSKDVILKKILTSLN